MRPSRAETPISTFKSIHSDSGGGCSSYVKSFNHLSCQMFENLTQVGGCVEEWFVLKESLCAVGRSGSGCLRTHRLPRSLLKIQMVGPHLELLPTGCCVEPQETDCRPGVPWRCPLLQRPPSRTTGHLPRDCMSHSHMKTPSLCPSLSPDLRPHGCPCLEWPPQRLRPVRIVPSASPSLTWSFLTHSLLIVPSLGARGAGDSATRFIPDPAALLSLSGL